MKQFYSLMRGLVAVALVLGMTSVTSRVQAATKEKQSSADVRQIQGTAEYQVDNGQWLPLKKGTTLKAGSVVKTGAGSKVDLSLDGGNALIRVMPSSTMKIGNLSQIGRGADADMETRLELQNGTVIGSVKKLSKASHFDIKTPNGVAGIRGTDFAVTVELMPDGNFKVTFTTITGELVAVGMVGADVITKVLGENQSWTIGEPEVITDPVKVQILKADVPIWIIPPPEPPQSPQSPAYPEPFVSPTIGTGEGGGEI